MSLQQHILSAAFPPMPESERAAVRESIKAVGVLNAITLFQGKVIDGWHRYTLSLELGVHCPTKLLPEGADPVAFVEAQNFHRRANTAASRALTVSKLHEWRMGGASSRKSNQELAVIADASRATIKQAKVVLAKGIQEVQDAVSSGEMGLTKASRIASLPRDQQAEAIRKPMPGKKVATQSPPPEEIPEDDGPSAEELSAAADLEQADRELMAKLVSSDDALAAAIAENKRLAAELRTMKLSRDEHMHKCNELTKTVATLQRKLRKLEQQ